MYYVDRLLLCTLSEQLVCVDYYKILGIINVFMQLECGIHILESVWVCQKNAIENTMYCYYSPLISSILDSSPWKGMYCYSFWSVVLMVKVMAIWGPQT